MNDKQLDDLKQFIDSRISQTEARFDVKLEALDSNIEGLSKELLDLRQEMLDGFAGVGDALEVITKQFDKRLTKLEQAA